MTAPDENLRHFGRSVAATALCNVAGAVSAGIAGIIIARALGPTMRGEYAAVMAWFGVVLVVGQLGQTSATTYFVAGFPERARDYLATSRSMMVVSGTATLLVGICVAPLLAHHNNVTTWAFRLMFATCVASFVGAGYVFGLQASHLAGWNVVRTMQPLAYVVAVGVLYLTGSLDLLTALAALSATVVVQTVLAHRLCRKRQLTGGSTEFGLARSLTRYGLSQLAASVPNVVTARLDQLLLALCVAPAVLGRYAVAVSLTTMAVPMASALGNVAFPRLASRALSHMKTVRLQRWSLLASAAVGIAFAVPLVLFAHQLIPLVFGAGFTASAGLVLLLAPGGVLLGCGQVCGDLLRGHGRPLSVARAQGAAAVITILLLAALVPLMGADRSRHRLNHCCCGRRGCHAAGATSACSGAFAGHP